MNGRRLVLILSALVVILALVVPVLGSEEQDWFVIENADAVATRAVLEAFTTPVPLDPRFILQDPKTLGVREVATVPPEMPRALDPRFILQDPKTVGVREVATVPPEMPRDLDPRFILQDPKTMGVREMATVPLEMPLDLDPRFILQDPKTVRHIAMAYPCGLVGEPDDPVISELQVTDLRTDQATISWLTDEYTDGLLEYGLAPGSYSWTAYDEGYGSAHSFMLTGLEPGTEYYYRVSSTDRCANTATSGEHSFRTLGDFVYLPLVLREH